MFRKSATALAVLAALCHAANAADDLKELREQVRQLKEQYEQRIQALEKRLEQAEKSATTAATQAGNAQVAAQQAAVQASSRPSGENAFNPALSLILGGTYANLSQDPARSRITGFVPSMGNPPPRRSFSLGESELAISANIDPNFRGTGIFALTPDNELEIEEAYVQTLALGRGFTAKAGRFLSAIGYQNEIHAHAWDFVDAPLVYKAFLGGPSGVDGVQFSEDGVQLRWVAPTDIYFDAGLELGRGRSFPAGPDGGRNKNGLGAGNVFAHLGGDIGTSTAWQAGLSYLSTSPQDRVYDDLDSTATTVTNRFSGALKLWTLSGVLKWAPNGNAYYNNFKLQGEYFRRNEQGTLTYDTLAASLGTQGDGLSTRQSGWYLQSVYQFMPQWRVGYRYDRLDAGTTRIGLVDSGTLTAADFPILAGYNPNRNTLMTDWSPSEFSRIRLQFARDTSRRGATDSQVFLQYIMSLGAHGAHKF